MGSFAIILFEISLPHLHYNVIQHVCEALSVNLCIFCPKLPGTHVVLQCSAMKKVSCFRSNSLDEQKTGSDASILEYLDYSEL